MGCESMTLKIQEKTVYIVSKALEEALVLKQNSRDHNQQRRHPVSVVASSRYQRFLSPLFMPKIGEDLQDFYPLWSS